MLTDVTVGWIGLGKMGRPMSKRLHDAGMRVLVNSRNQQTIHEVAAQGLMPQGSPREIAANADVVILTLFDSTSIKAVLEGERGVIAGLRRGSLVIDMGTTDVVATREFAATVAAVGGHDIDAPVSGGTRGAAEGTLTIMVGGDAADVQHAMPILARLGSHVTHVGPIGSGQVAKAVNQVIVGISIVAVAEAFTLAARAGIDLHQTREALQGGFADSRILREHGLRMIEGNYEPGGTMAVQRKDLDQALRLAKSLGIELPVTALCGERFNAAAAHGFDQLDQSAVYQFLQSAVS